MKFHSNSHNSKHLAPRQVAPIQGVVRKCNHFGIPGANWIFAFSSPLPPTAALPQRGNVSDMMAPVPSVLR